ARDEEERYKIWLARKSVAGAMAYISLGGNYTVDITVPRSRLAEILSEVNQICSRHDLRVAHVFHAGDGNLHPLILITEPDNAEFLKRVHAASYELIQCCADMGGSLTGEHGVGIEKRQFMPLMHNKAELMALWDVKQTFDPNNILNPGKIFPLPTQHESGPFAGYTLQHHKHNDKPASQQFSPEAELFTFTPTTAEVAAQSLSAFASVGRKVVITGGTCPPGATRNATQILSTRALRGIKTYAPDDLYITVGAGTPLKDVQSFLAQDGKQLAVASPWPDTTVGGLVAANVNAPLRTRYGSLRDLVLCATVALTDGRVIRTGRPIVKNVAGYDLTKVFVGSYGTLGLLTDISFKISTQPRMRRTLLMPVDDLRYALIWARQILPAALTASAIVLCKGYSAAGMPDSRYLLAYTAEGVPEDVQAELAQVCQILREAGAPEVFENEVITGTDIWAEVLGENKTANPIVTLRIGVPVRELPAYMQDQAALLNDGSFIADISNGLIYATRPTGSAEETGVW